MENDGELVPGHWKLAHRPRALHTYTHSRAHMNAPPQLARAPPTAGLCVRFGVGRSPTSPGISGPRTPNHPHSGATRTPAAGATGLARAAGSPSLHLSSQCRPSWSQSPRARGGLPSRPLKLPARAAPERGQLSRGRARARHPGAAVSLPTGEQRRSWPGVCGVRCSRLPREHCRPFPGAQLMAGIASSNG